jgi:hypothetical protein
MILRELVGSALGCFHFGAFHASFILALCAADATAKRRFPNEGSVGKRFKSFLKESMPQISGAKTYWVAVDMPEDRSALPMDEHGLPKLPEVGDDFRELEGRPRMVLMEGVLYHAFRCALNHEARLQEVELLPAIGCVRVQVDTKVRISADLIIKMLEVVIAAPENHGDFVRAVVEVKQERQGMCQ